MLETGEKAPAIKLADQDGTITTLKSFAGRRVLVYFYPKADTPGCTQQSCGLRDIAGRIGDTAIIGISPDPSPKQKKFADKYDLPFPLLADVDHAVAEAEDVAGTTRRFGQHLPRLRGHRFRGRDRAGELVSSGLFRDIAGRSRRATSSGCCCCNVGYGHGIPHLLSTFSYPSEFLLLGGCG